MNIGKTDRIIRIVVGIILIALVFLLKGNIRWIGLIGIVPLVTAIVGSCPLYKILGINTMKKK